VRIELPNRSNLLPEYAFAEVETYPLEFASSRIPSAVGQQPPRLSEDQKNLRATIDKLSASTTAED